MRRIREVLRLRDEFGASQREIAAACRMPRTTVRAYLQRADAAGLRFQDITGWADDELERRLFPPPRPSTVPRPVPDWAEVERELRRKGVTLELLWREYLERHPDGYRYTRFVLRFREWQASAAAPRLRREHLPGDAAEVDYAGMTLVVLDGGAPREAQVFVACLPCSGYLWAEATWTQRSEDWLGSHARLLGALGGVPARLVPDNLKAGVSHASFYDPVLNPGYHDLAQHYRTAVVPTRVRRPRDKASVENGVLQVERRVLAPLRDRRFASLDEANAAIAARVAELNAAPLDLRPGHSRASLFLAEERPRLRPLPPSPFVPGQWSRAKVPPDYHLRVGDALYSVPHGLVGKTVDVHATASTVAVFHRGARVACHARRPEGGRATLGAHRPAHHRALDRHALPTLAADVAQVGPATALLYERIREDADHPEQAVRAGLGLLRLGDRHGRDRLERACQAALEANVRSYRYVQRWLAAGPAEAPGAGTVGEHENVRGPGYYH